MFTKVPVWLRIVLSVSAFAITFVHQASYGLLNRFVPDFWYVRLMPLAYVVSVVFVLYLLVFKDLNTRLKKLLVPLFFVFVILLNIGDGLFPYDFRLKYLHGVTEESCKTGIPSVPWGYIKSPEYKDACFAELVNLSEFTSTFSNDDKFAYCKNLPTAFQKDFCIYMIGSYSFSSEDPDYCQSISDPEYKSKCEDRKKPKDSNPEF